MPHKHTRHAVQGDADKFDLPPTSIARPLQVRNTQRNQSSSKSSSTTKPKRNNGKKSSADDDTPKAFTRLMEFHRTGKRPLGLDDGIKSTKRKRGQDVTATAVVKEPAPEDKVPELKIQPNERLRDFAARVDQALPVGGLVVRQKHVDGNRRTKHEKRLRRMQAAWREEDARIKEREAEAREIAEEEEDENLGGATWEGMDGQVGGGRKKRKKGGLRDDDDWEELRKRRDEPKGLHDVAQAPPQFTKIPKEIFKVRNGAKADVADVPNASGSLRRREELGVTRQSVIEGYRRMMEDKRNRV